MDDKILRPGNSSRAGFLNETENLQSVLDADNATLLALDITHEQIADVLETIVGKTCRQVSLANRHDRDIWNTIKKGFNLDSVIKGLKVTFVSYRGYQYCPLCDRELTVAYGIDFTQENEHDRFNRSNTDFTISQNGKSIFFSELHIHLLRNHHFFEGHTKYRLDPAAVVEILELKPNVSYTPQYSTETIWQAHSGSSCSSYSAQDYINALNEKRTIYDMGDDVDINAEVAKRLGNDLIVIKPRKKGWVTFDGVEIELDMDCRHYTLTERKFIDV